jgi:hypothetical protein
LVHAPAVVTFASAAATSAPATASSGRKRHAASVSSAEVERRRRPRLRGDAEPRRRVVAQRRIAQAARAQVAFDGSRVERPARGVGARTERRDRRAERDDPRASRGEEWEPDPPQCALRILERESGRRYRSSHRLQRGMPGRHAAIRQRPRDARLDTTGYARAMPSTTLRSAGVLLALVLVACSDPSDETPLGREAAALLARPEQDVPKVTPAARPPRVRRRQARLRERSTPSRRRGRSRAKCSPAPAPARTSPRS